MRRKIMGSLLLMSVFIVLFSMTVIESGIRDAVIGWVAALVLALIVFVAGWLLVG